MIARQRLNAMLIACSRRSLVIATVDVTGVLTFSVSQRTNELGSRVRSVRSRARSCG